MSGKVGTAPRLRRLAPIACLALVAALAAAPRADAFIYWTANAGGLLRAANDGSQLGFLFDTPPFSDAVAIDSSHIYWTSSDGRIGRAGIDGSNPDPNFITGLPSYLPGLAVDGSHIYWSSLTAIGRAKLDGSGVEPGFIATNHASGVAVDARNIYWGENAIGKIGRAAITGAGANQSFIPAPGDPCSVTVDSEHVYWSDATNNTIGRAGLDGSAVEPAFIDPGERVDCGVAVFGGHVYFGIDRFPDSSAMARADLNGTGLQNTFFSLGTYGGPFVQMAVDARQPAVVPAGPYLLKVVGQVRNKRRGTARLRVKVGGPGKVILSGRQVRKVSRTAAQAGKLWLPVKPRHGLARRLRRKHRALAKLELRLVPSDEAAPVAKAWRLWLAKKPRRGA
jgi:hypothetical protein